MKKIFTLLAGILLSFNLWADPAAMGDGTGLAWELTDGTLTITYDSDGTGEMPDYKTTTGNRAPWYDSRTSITSIVLPDGLKTIGNLAFRNCSAFASVDIPSTVTSIGNSAFNGCSSLASVTINATTPPTLGSIVFNGCSAELKIYIPDAQAQLYANTWPELEGKLYQITSGDPAPEPHGEGDFGEEGNNLHWDVTGTVLTITGSGSTGNISFQDIPWESYKGKIKTVYLPDGITYIGEDVFFGVNADEVYISANPATLTWDEGEYTDDFKGDHATLCYVPINYLMGYNEKSVNLTFTVTPWTSGDCQVSIGGTKITISGTGAMADYANAAATPWADFIPSITAVEIESGVTAIGAHAFDGCSNLISIISNPTTPPTLGTDAFNGYNVALEISGYPCMNYDLYVSAWSTIPETAFSADCVAPANSCGNGLTWEINDNVLTITKSYLGDGAMKNYVMPSVLNPGSPWSNERSNLTSIVIGEGVTSIGDYAFYQCDNAAITSINIPSSVIAIGDHAFYNCDQMTSVEIPENVIEIDNYAFAFCNAMAVVEIPENVISIGNRAFYNCVNLTTVFASPTTAPTLGTDAFANCNNLTKIYYCGGGESYASAWSAYSSKLEEKCDDKETVVVTALEDPSNTGVYYGTFYHGTKNMQLPDNGTVAYVAELINESGYKLKMTKIADGADVIPANTGVILKGSFASFDMTESDEAPVSVSATNSLLGTDVSVKGMDIEESEGQKCYSLGINGNIGFKQYYADYISSHTAYVLLSTVPLLVPFEFEPDPATAIEQPFFKSSNPQIFKFIKDGVLYIERNGKTHTIDGRPVK